MRWILVCALIVSQARAEEQRLVPNTRMILLSNPNHFQARCGPGNENVHACTQYVGTKLSAPCAEANGVWSIRPTATYTALIYLFKPGYLRHENLHKQDIERAIDSYLQSLETRTFSSIGECEMTAQSESERFKSVMREFAQESNFQRGCKRRM